MSLHDHFVENAEYCMEKIFEKDDNYKIYFDDLAYLAREENCRGELVI